MTAAYYSHSVRADMRLSSYDVYHVARAAVKGTVPRRSG
jgi:hypothetical protein